MQHFVAKTRNRRARGLTLVEVLCATALAGSLLAGILVSQSAHLRQIRAAEQHRIAIGLLNRMLERWTAGRNDVPPDGDYPVPESTDWVCRVARVDAPDAKVLQAQIARIELWSSDLKVQGRKEAASVEMLVPAEGRPSR
ncbi:type IV pilus modification PilV family protein [Caulifigura coniformis]|uniref:type IV pilus modification PilV family protein n=1 Tax=Caulifigura coniformis TaxID=2527983 RepID=UPI0018D217A9|nr:type II secretion system protein [Caulifigura coniformis]